jgi:DNA repair exonuclease SbcCD ATPase subunit
MTLKDLLSRAGSWLEARKPPEPAAGLPEIDERGLISQGVGATEPPVEDNLADENSQVLVKTVPLADKTQSLEKLQAGFEKLVEQLEGINNHLNRQAAHHEELMKRLEQLPKLLESFPAVVENQKQLTEQLLEQLKAATVTEQGFVETIEKIPTETAKQTDALTEINHQLAAAAAVDVQMTEGLNKFNETLGKLDRSTIEHSESVLQMSKTFAASDRYLKYILSSQHKSFIWLFVTAFGVCLVVVLMLVGIIIYLRH